MKTSITVQNLKCGGCANSITKGVSELEGIREVNVEVASSTVTFDYETEQQLKQVSDKLRSLGYPSVDDPNTLLDRTKSFVSCATGKFGG